MTPSPECPACGATTAVPSHLGQVRFESFAYRYLACAGCGSLFADPMPGPAVLDRIYDTSYAATHYAAELGGSSSSEELGHESRRVLDEVSELRRSGAAPRLLDVGCGAGGFLVAASARGFIAEGHELQAASARVAADVTGRPVHAGPLDRLAGRYDVIHMADVLEHSPTPAVLLAQAISRLAPDGLVALRGPLENQANLFQRAMRLRRQIRSRWAPPPPSEAPPYHVNLFTLRGWHALLARSGLVTVAERVYEIHWPAPERFAPTAISLVKAASLALTGTPLGRRLALGNRVTTLLRSGR